MNGRTVHQQHLDCAEAFDAIGDDEGLSWTD
jgi:hypothetical protein